MTKVKYFKSSNPALLSEVKQNGLGKRWTATMDRRKNVETAKQKRRAEQNARRIQALEKENEKLKKRIKELEEKLRMKK